MVPDKFNMVDMEGIDIITSQGEVVEGLYQKLVESIAQCRYQCLYNWKFDGILIPPTYVEMDIVDDVVWINEGVSVDEEDVVRVYSLERPGNLMPIAISANGDYLPPEGYDGFDSVNVYIPPPVLDIIQITENGSYAPPQGVDGFSGVTVNVPSSEPVLSILNVVANGSYSPPSGVDGFSAVNVNVSGEVEPDLPSAYQRVEYLNFTPDVGIKVTLPQGYGLYTVTVSLNTLAGSSAKTFFGYRQSTTNNADFQFRNISGELNTWFRNPANGSTVQSGVTNVAVNTVYQLSGLLNIGSRTTALVGKYAEYSSSGVDGDCLDGKFYAIKGLDLSNFSTKCWLVPCYRKADNQVGIYDHLANVFYYETYSPSGVYSITPGPDVN